MKAIIYSPDKGIGKYDVHTRDYPTNPTDEQSELIAHRLDKLFEGSIRTNTRKTILFDCKEPLDLFEWKDFYAWGTLTMVNTHIGVIYTNNRMALLSILGEYEPNKKQERKLERISFFKNLVIKIKSLFKYQ